MRALVLILAIALLPLRGWVGDAMAVSLVAQNLAGVSATALAEPAPAQAMPDCPMRAQASDASTGEGLGSCGNCDTCNLCLAVLATSEVAGTPPSWLPQALRAGPGERFASAEAMPGIKPPIS